MRAYVVSAFDLGWDCVVAVYNADGVSLDDLEEKYPDDEFDIQSYTVRTEVTED